MNPKQNTLLNFKKSIPRVSGMNLPHKVYFSPVLSIPRVSGMNPFRSIRDAVNIRIPRVSGMNPPGDWGKSRPYPGIPA